MMSNIQLVLLGKSRQLVTASFSNIKFYNKCIEEKVPSIVREERFVKKPIITVVKTVTYVSAIQLQLVHVRMPYCLLDKVLLSTLKYKHI